MVLDTVKLEMAMTFYVYACPDIVLDHELVKLIWNRADALKRCYFKYRPEVSYFRLTFFYYFLGWKYGTKQTSWWPINAFLLQ